MCFVVYHSLSLLLCSSYFFVCFFFSSRRRHTRCALVTGVQTCALPIFTSSRPDWINERNKRSSRINYPSNACSPHGNEHPTRLYRFATYKKTHRLDSRPSHAAEQALEPRPTPPEFGAVVRGQRGDARAARRAERDRDLATLRRGGLPPDQAA